MQRRFPEANVPMLATAESGLVTGMFHVVTRAQVCSLMMKGEHDPIDFLTSDTSRITNFGSRKEG
jgi:hypothetical protein